MDASLHDAYADDYDRQVQVYGSYIHEALFGLTYEFVAPGQKLLDLGIGTGLAAEPFARAGAVVYGIDFSEHMLKQCRSKDFTARILRLDLRQIPWPFPPCTYDHVICCGVFHFLPELDPIFAETRRVLRSECGFGFTTKTPSARITGKRFERSRSGGLDIFSHSDEYVESLLIQNGFALVKRMRCYVLEDGFDLWIVRKLSAAC